MESYLIWQTFNYSTKKRFLEEYNKSKQVEEIIEYDESFNEVLDDHAQDEEVRNELDEEFHGLFPKITGKVKSKKLEK